MKNEIQINNEFHQRIPPLKDSEYAELKRSIITEGCRDALIVWNNILLDGHNRYKICIENSIPYKTKTIDLPDREAAKDWIDHNQLGRRNLTPDQMSLLRGRIYNRTKKAHGGARKSSAQNAHLKTADKLSEEFGVNQATIRRDAEVSEYLSKHPEEEKDVLSGKKTLKKIKKQRKQSKREAEREQIAKRGKAVKPSDRWFVEQGDIKTYQLKKQFDYIITDPPYPKEFIELYEVLARRANDWLKPGGLLIAMAGQSYLSEIYRIMSKHLDYYWTGCYLTPGQPKPLRQKQVNTNWKPLLFFVRRKDGAKYKGKIFGDVFKSDANDKAMHKWGQSVSGMSSIVTSVCSQGDFILDPFCGASTTGIAALKHGCLYHGIDAEQNNINISKGRLNDYTEKR